MILFILSRLFCNKTTIHARYKTIIKLFGYTKTKHVKILYYAALIIIMPFKKIYNESVWNSKRLEMVLINLC